jgi:signal peptide peptidase SppA
MRNENTVEAPLTFQLLSLNTRPWALSEAGLQSLVAACARIDFDAVSARVGQPLEEARGVSNYHGTAVINVRGPLFPYRSIWSMLFGGTSVEETAQSLRAAMDDPAVQRIVMAINSPGGQIDGINELANSIRVANHTKPVTAYVEGLAASGGYWLASAAGRIVADETALLGSIGVLATVIDEREAEEKQGVKRFEIVSSQSPLKRTDPATNEGRAQLQQMVDALASVFIGKVAKFRGTSDAKVGTDFGRGAVLPARDAVSVGMADALGSLESLITSTGGAPVRSGTALKVTGTSLHTSGGTASTRSTALAAAAGGDPSTSPIAAGDPGEDCECDDPENCDCEDQQAASDDPAPEGEGNLITPTAERQRIAAILTCEEARGREELARMLALETNHTVEAAQKILKASPAPAAAATPATNALDTRMSQIANPKVGVGAGAGQENDADAEVQRVLAYVPAARKYPVKVQ